MRKWLLAGSAGVAFATLASAWLMAQPVNIVPAPGQVMSYVPKQTYSAIWVGLVPAASATDIVCLAGSASKVVRLQSLKISGTATTAINLPMTILRRVSVDTGGTAGTTTANPANTISSRDTGQALATAATATPISYTANPTIVDTSPTYIDSQYILIATSATLTGPQGFDFAKDVSNLIQPPTLRGAAQQICLNGNATSIGAAGTTTGSITWTEE